MAMRLTDRSPRSKEEEVDMRIGLRYDREIAVELGVEATERNVFAERCQRESICLYALR